MEDNSMKLVLLPAGIISFLFNICETKTFNRVVTYLYKISISCYYVTEQKSTFN